MKNKINLSANEASNLSAGVVELCTIMGMDSYFNSIPVEYYVAQYCPTSKGILLGNFVAFSNNESALKYVSTLKPCPGEKSTHVKLECSDFISDNIQYFK